MTDQNAETTVPATDEVQQPTQLDLLKKRADAMGLKFHPSIGLDKLKIKLEEHTTPLPIEDSNEQNAPTPNVNLAMRNNKLTLQMRQQRKASKLVRIMLTCHNPAKREWAGEIFTASNSVVGSFKKFIPFNNDEGWHVPQIIVNMLLERECQLFMNERDDNNRMVKKGKIIKEFSVTILDKLTSVEINELTRRQAMANNIAD